MADADTGQDTAQDTGQDTGQDTTDVNLSDYVPKSEFNKIFGELKQWKQKARDAQGKALSDEERDEYEKYKADAKTAEEEKLAAKGKFQELTAKKDKEHAEALKAKDAVLAVRDKVIADLMIKNKVLTAATGKAVDPSKVVKLLKDNFKVEYNDKGEPRVIAVDDDGTESLDDAGNPASVEYFVKAYIDANPDLQPADVKSGSGGAATNRGTTHAGKAPTLAEQDHMTPEEIAKSRKQRRPLVMTQ